MKLIKKHIKLLLVVFITLSVVGAGSLLYLKNSQSELARNFRGAVGFYLHTLKFSGIPDKHDDINIVEETLYIDGVVSEEGNKRSGRDNKLVIRADDRLRLLDYANGFVADFPQNTVFDFSRSKYYVSAENEKFKAVISREWSVGENPSAYVEYYFNRFVLNGQFRTQNGITLLEDVKDDEKEKITIRVENLAGKFDMYTYLIFKTDSRIFFRIALKYNSDNTDMVNMIYALENNFKFYQPYGRAVVNVDFKPVLPKMWSRETELLYNRMAQTDKMLWGIFTQDVMGKGIDETIPAMEKKLDNKFDIVLAYVHLNGKFPTEFMEKCDAQGKTVELTFQLTNNNNEDLFAFSPMLDIYRGRDYEEIRAFARAAKAFGKPFLFRLNNEMNSDWTSYGGVNNLADPDIFVHNWQTMYRIFEEEGVDNAIWIFNPNDRDCPPNRWNSYMAYYPGNEFVHMIGVTGYNNGSYYNNVTGEYWREFDLIYDSIVKEFNGVFDEFPWMITEFSSSSIGGDKVKWIDNMFASLQKYPQIKAAVWFSYADYDFRPEKNGAVARPYWLDETEETMEAFRKGLMK